MQQQIIQFQEMQICQYQSHTASKESLSVKLSKLELPSFGGDKIRLKTFWDPLMLQSTKLVNFPRLRNLTICKAKLQKTKQRYQDSLSHKNYDVAINIIQERFGDKQSEVNKHYMKLINI
jgi:hypothetical protein